MWEGLKCASLREGLKCPEHVGVVGVREHYERG